MSEIIGTMPALKDRSTRASSAKSIGHGKSSQPDGEQAQSAAQSLISWWPVLLGVALGFLGPQLRDMLQPCDPWGMRIIYPFVLVAGRHEIGMSDELTRTLPQLLLFLQFPLEGLMVRHALARGAKLAAAFGQVVSLHAVCALVLWLVSGAAQ